MVIDRGINDFLRNAGILLNAGSGGDVVRRRYIDTDDIGVCYRCVCLLYDTAYVW
jgi:hypothetical protein